MFLIAVTSFEYDEDSSSKTYFHFGAAAAARKKSLFCFFPFNAWEPENENHILLRQKQIKRSLKYKSSAFNELHNANWNHSINYAMREKRKNPLKLKHLLLAFKVINIQNVANEVMRRRWWRRRLSKFFCIPLN